LDFRPINISEVKTGFFTICFKKGSLTARAIFFANPREFGKNAGPLRRVFSSAAKRLFE